MKSLKILTAILCVTFTACDKEVGDKGVVQDSVTGQRLEGVRVKMRSKPEDADVLTNNTGYFNATKAFSCGISTCDTDYTMEFTKPGYQSRTITNNYYNSPDAHFVTPDKKDTLIIELAPAQ